ncbi:MAG: Shedu anti-phage system protein SduA domain-containing protein [Dermatophilaceae bacterium]
MDPESTGQPVPAGDRLKIRRTLTFDQIRAADPLGEFLVNWITVDPAKIATLQTTLDGASDERPVQRYLQENPEILAQALVGGHGRWVIPQKRLGDRFVPDFVLGHRWSGPTWEWILVELQTPALSTPRNRTGQLFTRQGRMGEQLDEGLKQINEWRRWLEANLDYARRSRTEHGLGLTRIGANPPGLLLIGREGDLTPEHADMRKQLGDQHNVRIHSYNWLVRRTTIGG